MKERGGAQRKPRDRNPRALGISRKQLGKTWLHVAMQLSGCEARPGGHGYTEPGEGALTIRGPDRSGPRKGLNRWTIPSILFREKVRFEASMP